MQLTQTLLIQTARSSLKGRNNLYIVTIVKFFFLKYYTIMVLLISFFSCMWREDAKVPKLYPWPLNYTTCLTFQFEEVSIP